MPNWGQEVSYNIQYSGTESAESSPLLNSRVRERTFHKFVWIIFLTILFGVGTGIGLYLLWQEEPKWYTATPLYFIPRESWGANPSLTPLSPNKAILTHAQIAQSSTPACSTAAGCAEAVRNIQRDHVTRLNQSDVAYNFIVGGDGRTYEGRGWRCKPGFGEGNGTLLIAFLGDFRHSSPNKQQFQQATVLIQEAIDQKVLDNCFTMSLFKQDDNTELANVFQKLKTEVNKQRLYLKCGSVR